MTHGVLTGVAFFWTVMEKLASVPGLPLVRQVMLLIVAE